MSIGRVILTTSFFVLTQPKHEILVTGYLDCNYYLATLMYSTKFLRVQLTLYEYGKHFSLLKTNITFLLPSSLSLSLSLSDNTVYPIKLALSIFFLSSLSCP